MFPVAWTFNYRTAVVNPFYDTLTWARGSETSTAQV
jgi:hypothetical protein